MRMVDSRASFQPPPPGQQKGQRLRPWLPGVMAVVVLVVFIAVLLMIKSCFAPSEQETADSPPNVTNSNSTAGSEQTGAKDDSSTANAVSEADLGEQPAIEPNQANDVPSSDSYTPYASRDLGAGVAEARSAGQSYLNRIKKADDGSPVDAYYATLVYARETLRLLLAVYQRQADVDDNLINNANSVLNRVISENDRYLVHHIARTVNIVARLFHQIASAFTDGAGLKPSLGRADALCIADYESEFALLAASADSAARSVAVMVIACPGGYDSEARAILTRQESNKTAAQMPLIDESIASITESLRIGLIKLKQPEGRIAEIVNRRNNSIAKEQQRFPRMAVQMRCVYEMSLLFFESL